MRLNRIAPASRRSPCHAQSSQRDQTRGRRIINPICRRKIALFPLPLPHTGIGQRPGRGRRSRGIEHHAAWSRQLLNAASRSPARGVFRNLAILPNPSPEAPGRRCGDDFQDRGCVTHVVARTIRWQLNAEAACVSRAITGLVWEKRFSRSLLRADLHDNAVQTALPLSGLQLGLDGPRLFFLPILSEPGRRAGTDPAPTARSWHQRNPGFKLADGALQAGEALSLSA